MPDTASVTYLDNSNEKANVQFNIATLTAANLDDQDALFLALLDAAADITLGVMNKRILTHKVAGSALIPTGVFAQKETKWLVGYTDVSTTIGGLSNPYYGKKFTVEVATPDLDNANLQTNSDYAALTDTQVAAFVTAFQAYVRSPTGGAVTIQYIKLVGRKG